MKKILFLIIISLFLISNFVYANDAQRKISTGTLTTSQSVATVASTLYDVEIIATSNGGYATIFDYGGTNVETMAGKTELVEVKEATQYNSKHVNLGEYGIKAFEGIYIFLHNATAILHYR